MLRGSSQLFLALHIKGSQKSIISCHEKAEPLFCFLHRDVHRDISLRTLMLQDVLEPFVVIAIEGHLRHQVAGHLQRIELTVLHSIQTESEELPFLIHETKSVTIGKGFQSRHRETVMTDFLHFSHFFTHRFRGIKRENTVVTSIEEIAGKTSVETLTDIGTEFQFHYPIGCPLVFVGLRMHNAIECLAIGCRHVLYIRHIFQPPFNLERCSTCLDQVLQGVNLAHVFQRQQMFLLHQRLLHGLSAFLISTNQVELHAAHLRTSTSIGASPEQTFTCIALAAETHTQSTMYENLKSHIGTGFVNGSYLRQRQFTCQNHLVKAITL